MSAPPPIVLGPWAHPSAGWPTLAAGTHDVVAALGAPLRLAADPEGPGRLDDPDGTLGGLIDPWWLALDASRAAYVVDASDRVLVLRDVPEAAPAWEPGDPRSPRRASAIRTSAGLLWIVDHPVDGEGRLQVLTLRELLLVALIGEIRAVDVAPRGDGAVVLSADGTVWEVAPNLADVARLRCSRPLGVGARRIAVDSDGGIHLLLPGPRLVELDAEGRQVGETHQAATLGGRFPPPAATVDAGVASISAEALACAPAAGSETAGAPIVIGRDGRAPGPPPDPPAPRAVNVRTGTWTSRRIDARLDGTVWHRVELRLRRLPPGTAVEVQAAADDHGGREPPAGESWTPVLVVSGATQSHQDAPSSHDALFRGTRGRFLWLRLVLTGDGTDTPAVDSLRAHWPRDTALQYLPAAFGAEPRSRDFLERFLSIFQTTWDDLERETAELPLRLDPDTLPDDARRRPLLDMLASWIGAALEPGWDDEQRRRAIDAEPDIAARRGTPSAVGEELRLAVAGLTGVPPDELGGLPALVECFRTRAGLELGRPGRAELGRAARLGADGGGTGPRRAALRMLEEHAHRFRAYVPADWVRTDADELALRRALDRARPAHTAYELRIIGPRMRLGTQSTLGLDTVLTAIGPVCLPRSGPPSEDPAKRPPRSGAPGPILGIDALLGDGGSRRRSPRLGVDTTLASR